MCHLEDANGVKCLPKSQDQECNKSQADAKENAGKCPVAKCMVPEDPQCKFVDKYEVADDPLHGKICCKKNCHTECNSSIPGASMGGVSIVLLGAVLLF